MLSRKFAIIFDDFDNTTKDRNVGLFAQLLADKGIKVDIITSKQNKNKFIKLPKNITLLRLQAAKEWPELNHNIFYKFIDKNISNYYGIWLYKGRPYASSVIDTANNNNVTTIIKLDSDKSFSLFGKVYFNFCNIFSLNPKAIYYRYYKLFALFSFIPSINGFLLYDSIFLKSSIILAETYDLKKEIKKKYINSNVLVYPNSVPISKFTKIENNLKVKKQKKILSVGRITRVKNFENAIMAYGLLKNDLKEDWKYEIVGPIEDKKYYYELKKLILSLKLSNHIKITTGLYGNKLYKKYIESSIFILPSKREGQPNVLVEAMYFNNIIIAKKSPEVNFIFSKKTISYLLDEVSSKEIYSALKKSIYRLNEKKDLTNVNKNHVIENFNLDIIGENLFKEVSKVDYNIYLNDQKNDSLSVDKRMMKKTIYKYLKFLEDNYDLRKIALNKAKVIDIGCREFFTYDFFIERYNLKIKGIDIGIEALEYSKQKKVMNVDIHLMDKKLKNNEYNLVLAFHVFEHMYNIDKALSNCNYILRKGGLLYFALPFPSADTRRGHWLNIKTIYELDILMRNYGFKKKFLNLYKKNEFRNEPEVLGLYEKN